MYHEYLRKYPINFRYSDFPRYLDKQKFYFSNKWFALNVSEFYQLFCKKWKYGEIKNILEVGSFEGRSTVFMLENIPNTHVTCIDPFLNDGTEYLEAFDQKCYSIFMHNIQRFKNRVTLIQEKSQDALPRLIAEEKLYDVIYVDGSHMSSDVWSDLSHVSRLVRKGGVVLCDDYGHSIKEYPELKYLSPPVAINLFFRNHWKRFFTPIYVSYSIGFVIEKELPKAITEDEKRIHEKLIKRTEKHKRLLKKFQNQDSFINKAFLST